VIDGKKRAFFKAVSWRIVASCVLASVTWVLLGSLKAVGLITLFYNLIQILVYFLHERAWNYVNWGRTKGLSIQMTGMSGAGKTTISQAAAKKLRALGYKVELIDGDEYRQNVSRDLGFSKEDRLENIHRLGFIGRVLARNSVISIMATINPYVSARKNLSEMGALTVYIKCGLEELKRRDPKGLYRRALLEDGHPEKINNFTGITDPFEAPDNPDLIIDTSKESIDKSVKKLCDFILEKSS
jgi:adenylylsulfate kinase